MTEMNHNSSRIFFSVYLGLLGHESDSARIRIYELNIGRSEQNMGGRFQITMDRDKNDAISLH